MSCGAHSILWVEMNFKAGTHERVSSNLYIEEIGGRRYPRLKVASISLHIVSSPQDARETIDVISHLAKKGTLSISTLGYGEHYSSKLWSVATNSGVHIGGYEVKGTWTHLENPFDVDEGQPATIRIVLDEPCPALVTLRVELHGIIVPKGKP